MSNAYICEVNEPQSDAAECQCSVCGSSLSDNNPKYMMNRVFQNNLPDFKGKVLDFEREFDFDSVLEWGCTNCGSICYNLYINKFECLAGWYDRANSIGSITLFDEDEDEDEE